MRQFREKVRTVLQDKDREVQLKDTDPLLYTDLGLETVLLLLEQGRKSLEEKEELQGLLKRFKNILQANLLCLEAKQNSDQSSSQSESIVRYTDFNLPTDLTEALCRPTGLYGRLARIRFTHQFNNNAADLKIAEAEGHPKLGAIAAVPLFKEDRPTGCLAAIHDKPRKFTDGYIMLLFAAAEIVSIVESGGGGLSQGT